MANIEQLEILKQGIEKWNKWREENPGVIIDLREADLRGAHLRGANLIGADLWHADLWHADLMEAHLREADLRGVHLQGADLTGADLGEANLMEAHLWGAHLTGADLMEAHLRRVYLMAAHLHGANLIGANLIGANLIGANLREAHLIRANLQGANLTGADLTDSYIGQTIYGNNDLSSSLGLETIVHGYPSTIGTDTISNSKGKIPIEFLRGCGLNDWEIEAAKLYNPDLSNEEINNIQYKIYDLRATQALQISPLFISYSHGDGEFVDKIGACLTEKGIRYWRDIHDMKAGRMEKQIDIAIRQNPTVLLVLSKNSLQSDWVEHEVRTARSLEKEMGRDVLCPVALDDSWKSSPWPRRVMEQVMEYNILDYAGWEDNDEFQRMFARLVDGLDLYYKKDQ